MFIDFQFCNDYASSKGYFVCRIDQGSGMESVQNGADIEFSTVHSTGSHTDKHIASKYKEPLTFTFHICKKSHSSDPRGSYISVLEQRDLNRWLNRNDGYHTFKLVDSNYSNISFHAYINTKKIEFAGNCIGYELTVITDKPFGYLDEVSNAFPRMIKNRIYAVPNLSDEICDIYPYVEIICLEDGDLKISNRTVHKTAEIKGCLKDEKIIMDCASRIISSSVRGDGVINYFNFGWLRIGGTYENKINRLETSLDINFKMKYSPVAKVGV